MAYSADVLDAPWEVDVAYQPPNAESEKGGKRFKPWKKVLKTQGEKRELSLGAMHLGSIRSLELEGR